MESASLDCKQCPLYGNVNAKLHPIKDDIHMLRVDSKRLKKDMKIQDDKLTRLYVISVISIILGCIKIYMEFT